MGVSNVPAASAAGLQPKYQKFTSSGTFTLPTGYGPAKPLLVNIQVIGGGGGGSASRATSSGNLSSINIIGKYIDYFGQSNQNNWTFNAVTVTHPSDVDLVNTLDGSGGGSGGIAQTQMYLTENLTITVGAAGTRPAIQNSTIGIGSNLGGFGNIKTGSVTINGLTNETEPNPFFVQANITSNTHGGSGGTSSAGAVTATGGAGGTGNWSINRISNINTSVNGRNNTNSNATYTLDGTNLGNTSPNSISSIVGGTAGQPAGTAGLATPLLGAVAGGSGSSTSVKGAFGVGGIKTDGATHSGVEGTGGGFGSVGASGAVILTWWE